VTAEPAHVAFVQAWAAKRADVVTRWIKDNPGTPQPKTSDLAVVFFASFSTENPGRFPSAVARPVSGSKVVTVIELVKEGTDLQSTFFDMWRHDHADADLEPVPADMVMASGSGLDPHVTLESAEYQLPRVASAWAERTHRDPALIRTEVDQLLRSKAGAPLGGLVGEPLVNVLEINLALGARYGSSAR
jgi:K+-transporting ATPase ATPase C chain